MEGFDKSRVLDVKPLRCLKPVFPNASQGPPSAPHGFAPFYPFSAPQGSRNPPDLNEENPPPPMHPTFGPIPAPIRSYRNPNHFPEGLNGDVDSTMDTNGDAGFLFARRPSNAKGSVGNDNGSSQGSGSSRRKPKKKREDSESGTLIDLSKGGASSEFPVCISPFNREDGNREMVNYVMLTFDAVRRRLSQIEDTKQSTNAVIKRPDLKAGNILMTKKVRTNMNKRIGAVPGVEIGDIFFFRMEMCVVGLHAPSMAGIDYMSLKGDLQEDPVALSIVSSGGYDDDVEDSDVLIYSGHGGMSSGKEKQAADQKLERGNLALETSLHRANEVRVIRGMKDFNSATTKIYIYDGLYKVKESWVEKGKSGCNMFKYKLERIPGQPGAFTVWRSIQKWKEGLSSRHGVVLQDITSGSESIPVSLVNDVDNEKGPAYFTYFPTIKYPVSFNLVHTSYGCNCNSACVPNDLSCSCIQNSGGDFPFTANGILVSRKPLIHECGPSCRCFPNCKNRVSQSGVKIHLEVFKTKDRGWGLRSLDPLRAGSFICEYAGEVIDKFKLMQNREEIENDEYVFDTSRVCDSFKWNYEPALLGEESSNDANEDYIIPSRLVISSKNVGNVARFINHSCSPNIFWQPILYEHNNQSSIHIAFFAIRHIPPMTELTYDYGVSSSSEADNSNPFRWKKKCLCGSSKCRGHLT
ncbi:histone-lysine N-methyltransferase, H3 lysine-9 specific SUVH1 [Ziziphus jujuba]|uniref:Histone-lysine N-methyltransferase, H3 lysine-9 specific SUVH1 n=1 Tax=Ziziphus jujuba TaxID=326968 RepID=A0A6P3ZC10_ZIZJJ|nr:histone-lysine N-methyltransferase, H3 lysine-9 specific SUVH1 [Ziziphus jujuba]XP_015876150.2 histone-lysine N-methyltransferase, H3 lysine-9 specific SUVH1 [Ziziphus jujuba]XP_015876151.2 histone-lysine N-methyltransferase, H3 lysine-9 specific SUVH1 [Ziziphus jujuba]XP_015876152.2 histone-lysine N-methyltransferase, H3 lysine-9 specific SUVH1 [Ziziphus jujuba]XP_048325993.2 histone-lysine N-methyltransferase, H3 lysine-9 specific SUVH1 [Ziziphus jujuba]XP_048325994.2 histone-lysine N-met